MKYSIKSNIFVYMILCVCIICGGCSIDNKTMVSTSSDIDKNVIETAIDEVALMRIEKKEAYMSQNIIEKIKSAKLVTEYDNDTLVDDMDSVMMGRCCQVDDRGKDYIDWLVLDRDEEKALILSKYILDNVSYSLNDLETAWDISNVRKWLNEDFYVNAFSDEEKSIVLLSIIHNPPNTRWTISGGTDTKDRVFLLSDEEARKYFYQEDMCSENRKLATYPTKYAKNVENYTSKLWVADNKDKWFDGYCSYYLRVPGVSRTEVSVVNQYGYLNTFGAKCHSYNYGIRPAMWINLNGADY